MLVLLICLNIYLGCGHSVTRVPIRIQVDSAIDVSKYSGFVVLPFIEERKSDDRQVESNEDTGQEIGSLIRIGLGRHQHLDVIGTQETMRMLIGESIDEGLLSDVERLVRLGQYLEVDAVIAGSYTFFARSVPRPYYRERYSTTLQRYVTDYQDYLEKTYILSLRIVIASVDTLEIIRDDKYERSAVQAHTVSSFLVSEVLPHEGILKNLAKQAISEFTRQIAPHYETEERFLVK